MSRYLDMVDGPEHVKKLTLPQLQELAGEIRQELISVLARNGGHLGPNLGVVELTHRAAPRLQHAQGQIRLGREPSGVTSTKCSPAAKTVFGRFARRTA